MKRYLLLLATLSGLLTTATAQSTSTPNLVKVNPLALANGYFPVAYERILMDRLGVEVGFGPTYRDFLYHFLYDAATKDERHGEFSQAYFGVGAYGALRLYLAKGKTAPEGLFLAAQFQYRTHSFDQAYTGRFNPLEPERDLTRDRKTRRSISDLALLLGWQAPLAGSLFTEFNFGLGLRYRSVDRVKVERNLAGIDEFRDDKPGNTTASVILNLKLGYAF
jgi:hypothetical protein